MNRTALAALPCVLALCAAPAAALAKGGAKGGATAAVDHDFGCDVSAFSPTTWEAKGIQDVGRYKSHFKLLKSVSSSDSPSTLGRNCKNLPKTPFFVKSAGGGGVTRADILVAIDDVKVYRGYSKGIFACGIAKPAAKWGSWWSVVPLPGPRMKNDYRESVGVCDAWNDFSMQVECTLKKGTVVAIGPTQAADCASDNAANTSAHGCKGKTPAAWHKKLPSKPTHQVYLNTYGRPESELEQFLTDCHTRGW